MKISKKPCGVFTALVKHAILILSFSMGGILYAQPQPAGSAKVQAPVVNSSALQITEIQPAPGAANPKKEIGVHTDRFTVILSSKGGQVTEFRHLDKESKLRNDVNLTDPDPFPFSVYSNRENQELFENANYRLSESKQDNKTIITASLPIVLIAGDKKLNGELIKKFTFAEGRNYWQFDWQLTIQHDKPVLLTGFYFYPVTSIGPAGDEKSPRSSQTNYNFQHVGTEFELFYMGEGSGFFSCGANNETKHSLGQVNFFGRSSRFMTAAFMPFFDNDGLYFFPQSQAGVGGKAAPQQMHLQLKPMTSVEDQNTQKISLEFGVFTGPKVKSLLNVKEEMDSVFPWRQKIHPDLYKAFDFGITAPIRDLIVSFLNLLYGVIPNYGIGIILFALLFKIVFFPLNQKQAESMKKMSALQPLMKEINEKYKENPQEKQRRTLALYKEHKVNPMSGCLPMVIQIPIFIALYSAFSDSYDLWKAPFIPGWISDLSEPDVVFLLPVTLPLIGGFAFHLLPILMTVTQFFQTKMTMVSGDDSQKKIMQLMPLIMLFFFWNMPAGVVLYWTIQNLLSVAQQVYTNLRKKEA
ncbi:MAG: membrane protein insertase YidC [Leptospiraceae bacterium]|nr:membrane protein insertase YidC [Leptospiraceae bacterium]